MNHPGRLSMWVYMKRLLWVSWAYLLLAAATPVATAAQLAAEPYQGKAAHLFAEMLARFHYKKTPLNDETSGRIFERYINALDGEKIYFTRSDINQFRAARTLMDDAILGEDLGVPFRIFNRYQERVSERIDYARTLLVRGFEFDSAEHYQYVRKNAPWVKSSGELNALWRKRVKNDWLRLRLAGKDDKSIAATLDKRYSNILKRVHKIHSGDAFQIFMDAYAAVLDPHTSYFGVRAADDFDMSMRLSLVGIGAVLQERDEFTAIRELLAGGPAALSGKLKVGDRIVGVGQGENDVPTDVTGWRIDDTVALIRGAEDSVVLLDVLPAGTGPDGEHKLVTLVRKKVSLDKQAAKKSVIEVRGGNEAKRIGVITLPGFYLDFAARQKGDKDYRSATRDVARLLDELKAAQVDAVLIDLRNNGGGSLDEAIALTGLFIDQGPVLQQRDSSGAIAVQGDTHPGQAWEGPLGVLINRASASASEIFAAAIQDYGRGIVIGEKSFGKGTVQTVVNLDEVVNNEKPEFGEIKMTVAQFFRINGGTTQLRGVIPDIRFPATAESEDFGEASYDNALPWMQINGTHYRRVGDISGILPLLKEKHEARVAQDKEFQYLREDIAEFNRQREQTRISLNQAERRKEREVQAARIKARALERNDNVQTGEGGADAADRSPVQDDGLLFNERELADDLAQEHRRGNARDILLHEAVHILGDEVELLKRTSQNMASGQTD